MWSTDVEALLARSKRETEHANIFMIDCCRDAAVELKLSLFSIKEVAVWKMRFPNSTKRKVLISHRTSKTSVIDS